jgi:ATP-dependent RNA helicase DDX35
MLKKLSSTNSTYSVISSCADDTIAVRKCLITGYFDHAAQLKSDGKYHTIRGKVTVGVHHTSVFARFGAPPEWVVFNDIVHNKEALIRDISKIEPRWLLEIAPHYYKLSK